ncbi:NADH-quinone oxidoreductase subunit NuoE [Litorivita sp. NS0012-18]|uniref:NADH-quinone oxidoreductase subunit NuoE n=1 Tax=Litorivita sp. NS0012-18 TaxID=3127655 RepID=UPI0031063731
MLRRLHHTQPDSFAFAPANQAWAEAQITKFPEGRQASAVIPLLWRAQEQEGWLTRPAIEHIADMLGMAYMRVVEVASFYFMFQLQPVGSVAHIQVCGTTSCMICGAEDLIAVCKEKIAGKAHELSGDGKFSWEEVECLGACANAPMAQIGKDYYEDLTAARLSEIIDELGAGKVPVPGPQNGRYAAEPASGVTSLAQYVEGRAQYNASVQAAVDIGDTVKRIDGTEVPLVTPWQDGTGKLGGASAGSVLEGKGGKSGAGSAKAAAKTAAKPAAKAKADSTGATKQEAKATSKAKPKASAKSEAKPAATKDAAATKGGVKAKKVSAAAAKKAEAAPKTAAKSTAKTAAKPAAKTAAADKNAPTGAGKKPRTMKAPRKAGADDLKQIKGVGPKLEALLHSLGFFHFDQVAKWSADEVAWVDDHLGTFRGRVARDNWIEQATKLAAGEETEFSAKVKKGGVY